MLGVATAERPLHRNEVAAEDPSTGTWMLKEQVDPASFGTERR
jgi:hypothetical protein